MFLSKVEINIENKDVVLNFYNSNFWHKKVMEGFVEYLDPSKTTRKENGILFRKEVTDRTCYLLIQSKNKPNWFGKSWVKDAQIKNIDNLLFSFQNGIVLNLDILCSPYKTNKETNRPIFLKTVEDKKEWFKEKGKYNGFEVLSCIVQKNNTAISGFDNSCVKIYLTQFIVQVRITDFELFREFYKNGVGRLKSYGAGMLIIR